MWILFERLEELLRFIPPLITDGNEGLYKQGIHLIEDAACCAGKQEGGVNAIFCLPGLSQVKIHGSESGVGFDDLFLVANGFGQLKRVLVIPYGLLCVLQAIERKSCIVTPLDFINDGTQSLCLIEGLL